MKTFITPRFIGALALVLFALCIAGIARAQTPPPWDTNVLDWTPSTTCSDGSAIDNCPVSSYIIERASSSTGTFSQLTVVSSTTTHYEHTSAAAGTNCYRVKATTPTLVSAPSNVACKTNVRPTPAPNPPTLRIAQTMAGMGHSPVWTLGANDQRTDTFVGLVKNNTDTLRTLASTYRGFRLCEIGTAFIEPMKGFQPAQGQKYCAPCA